MKLMSLEKIRTTDSFVIIKLTYSTWWGFRRKEMILICRWWDIGKNTTRDVMFINNYETDRSFIHFGHQIKEFVISNREWTMLPVTINI